MDWLIEREITLADGTSALLSYDTEGDMLEIFFAEGAASGTIELADGVLLRLEVEHARPLSLAFLCATTLMHTQVYGPPCWNWTVWTICLTLCARPCFTSSPPRPSTQS